MTQYKSSQLSLHIQSLRNLQESHEAYINQLLEVDGDIVSPLKDLKNKHIEAIDNLISDVEYIQNNE